MRFAEFALNAREISPRVQMPAIYLRTDKRARYAAKPRYGNINGILRHRASARASTPRRVMSRLIKNNFITSATIRGIRGLSYFDARSPHAPAYPRDMAQSRRRTGKLLDYRSARIIDRFLQSVRDTRTHPSSSRKVRAAARNRIFSSGVRRWSSGEHVESSLSLSLSCSLVRNEAALV